MTALQQAIRAHQAGLLQQAETMYRDVLTNDPANPDALHLLGVALHQLNRSDEGYPLITRAAALRPNDPGIQNNLGEVCRTLRRRDEALAAYQRAIQLQPNYAAAYSNLALLLCDLGRFDEAAEACRLAIALKPDYAKAQANLSIALHALGRLDQAVDAARAAVRNDPEYVEGYNNLGNTLRALNRLDEAADAFGNAIALRPEHATSHYNLGGTLSRQGDLDAAMASLRQALRLRPDYVIAHDTLLFTMLYSERVTQEQLHAEHQRWSETFESPLAVSHRPHTNDRSPDRKLRIGYVSPDLRRHPVGYFMRPIFRHHDKEQFEVFAYSGAPRPDSATDFFRAHASAWRDTYSLSDEQLAEQIRADRIDILIDLTLHMGHSRLLAFARKPAPVQVTYLGYPYTTGLKSMDYKLTDPHLDPTGAHERFHNEQLIRLPQTWFCCEGEPDTPPVGELPARASGHVTFISQNTLMKVTPPVIDAWSRILHEFPRSRLVLIASGLASPGTRHRMLRLFADRSVDPARIEMGDLRSIEEGFATLTRADIALDTFPYSGGTTSVNALWMGLPLVTLAADTPVGRQGVSLNTNMGLTDLIARDIDEYVTIATALARHVDRLANVRLTLRQRMLTSPLCDGPTFVRNLESAYRAMWRSWCTS